MFSQELTVQLSDDLDVFNVSKVHSKGAPCLQGDRFCLVEFHFNELFGRYNERKLCVDSLLHAAGLLRDHLRGAPQLGAPVAGCALLRCRVPLPKSHAKNSAQALPYVHPLTGGAALSMACLGSRFSLPRSTSCLSAWRPAYSAQLVLGPCHTTISHTAGCFSRTRRAILRSRAGVPHREGVHLPRWCFLSVRRLTAGSP